MQAQPIRLYNFGIKAQATAQLQNAAAGDSYLFEYFDSEVILQDGKGRRRFDGGVWVLFPPGEQPNYLAIEPLSHTWCHIGGPGVAACLDRYAIPVGRPIKIDSPLFLLSFLEAAQERLTHAPALNDEFATLLCRSFLRSLARSKIDNQRSTNPPGGQIGSLVSLRRSRAVVHAELARRWTLDEMACLVSLSASHYLALYKRYFHVSPYQDLIQARLRRMNLLVQYSNISIERAADRCGFSSPSQYYSHYGKRPDRTDGNMRRKTPANEISLEEAERLISLLFVEPAAYWSFDHEDGDPKQDFSGKTSPLEFKPGVTVREGRGGGGALYLGRTGAHAQLSDAVIDSKLSFTVSAWVWNDASAEQRDWMTAVSIGNENHCSFYLQRSGLNKCNMFTVTPSGANAATIHVKGILPLSSRRWVHLTGVHDSVRREVSLWENGVFSAMLPYETPWSAPGPTRIGAAVFSGSLTDIWHGRIDDVRLYQRVLTSQEIFSMYSFNKVNRRERTF